MTLDKKLDMLLCAREAMYDASSKLDLAEVQNWAKVGVTVADSICKEVAGTELAKSIVCIRKELAERLL